MTLADALAAHFAAGRPFAAALAHAHAHTTGELHEAARALRARALEGVPPRSTVACVEALTVLESPRRLRLPYRAAWAAARGLAVCVTAIDARAEAAVEAAELAELLLEDEDDETEELTLDGSEVEFLEDDDEDADEDDEATSPQWQHRETAWLVAATASAMPHDEM